MIKQFRGPVHRPGDAGYDAQRAAFNPNLDARPVLVAEATGAADVRAAVTWARNNDVPLAVQATGHGTHVPADGALLLKTGRMATVLIDPDRRVAKVGPGARWGEVISAAAPFGLVPLSGTSPSVGVAGYTFGGGQGLLSRTFGLAADSLVRADVVTAYGEQVIASADRSPELFWALRGGGGNFGVATSLEVRLYPVSTVYSGVARFPVERAAETIAFYEEWTRTVPDTLTAGIVLDQSDTFAVKVIHAGDAASARKLLRPLWSIAGTPVSDELNTVRYREIVLPSAAPRHFDLYQRLPEPMIDDLVGVVRGESTMIEIKHWGGAIAKTEGAGPAAHRDVPFSVTVSGGAGVTDPIAHYAHGGSFLNFLHDPERVHTAYTPANFQRLRAVKRAYDPENLFRANLNIAPAGKLAVAR